MTDEVKAFVPLQGQVGPIGDSRDFCIVDVGSCAGRKHWGGPGPVNSDSTSSDALHSSAVRWCGDVDQFEAWTPWTMYFSRGK
jgi:hypothetical protein